MMPMRKIFPSAFALVAIGAFALVGCAKDVEPTATPTTEPTTTETTPPAETTPEEAALPDKPADGEEVAVLDTDKGRMVVMVYPQAFPENSKNFMSLVKSGFYTGTRFHRCIAGFMIQGGDPGSKDLASADTWGTGGHMEGGKEVTVPFEGSSRLKHAKGVISMAHAGNPDGASSQFFIMAGDAPHLDSVHTAFGRVVEGLDVIDKIIVTGDAANNGAVKPNEAVVIKSAKIEKWPVKK